ncbi:MAG: nuclear transport factor 2 family protein [Novosphingobium sp.]
MLIELALLAASPVTLPAGPALTEEVRRVDERFFALFFDRRCHVAEIRAMVADDIEMYHDKGGVVARSAKAFMADYRKACAEREKPEAWRSRRELVAGSLLVDPVPGFGAIEHGEHRFFERKGEGAERLAGTARFTQIWQKMPSGWKLKRVISFAHKAAD